MQRSRKTMQEAPLPPASFYLIERERGSRTAPFTLSLPGMRFPLSDNPFLLQARSFPALTGRIPCATIDVPSPPGGCISKQDVIL